MYPLSINTFILSTFTSSINDSLIAKLIFSTILPSSFCNLAFSAFFEIPLFPVSADIETPAKINITIIVTASAINVTPSCFFIFSSSFVFIFSFLFYI